MKWRGAPRLFFLFLFLFLLAGIRQSVETGTVSLLVEALAGSQEIVHFLAEAERDLGFRFGLVEPELEQAGQRLRDVGSLRRCQLLFDRGKEVGKKVVVHRSCGGKSC